MARILVIDSHRSSNGKPQENLHWKNAKAIADHLHADLIWSYPQVNHDVKSGYDSIIFVHASHYSYTDYKWLELSPKAALFYVVNEYNLGEPRTLWTAAKDGRNYTVIANHPSEASKVVQKYVSEWKICNLNAISYNPSVPVKSKSGLFRLQQGGCVYYGNYRSDRKKYFVKYLNRDGVVTLSTSSKNEDKFRAAGINCRMFGRIIWPPKGEGLKKWKCSLYLEDETTHVHYNFLANRFYEALNQNVRPVFDQSCHGTVRKSGYPIDDSNFVDGTPELRTLVKSTSNWSAPRQWHKAAMEEKASVLEFIRKTVC